VSFQLSFDNDFQSNSEVAMDVFVEVIFLMDIAISFITSTRDKYTGALITSKAMLRGDYTQSWLLLDCVSSVPVEIIGLIGMNEGGFVGALKVLRLLKITRLLKLLHIRIPAVLAEAFEASAMLQLARLLVVFTMLLHLSSCIMWGLVVYNDYAEPSGMCTRGLGPACYSRVFYMVLIILIGNQTTMDDPIPYYVESVPI
jgi:hypothetical protein